MDRRRAYAIANPVGDGYLPSLRDGHRLRVDYRYLTTVWCDGDRWYARVEYLGYNLRPMKMASARPDVVVRMRQVADALLSDGQCGDGMIETAAADDFALVARRSMTDAERVAIGRRDQGAA